MFRVAWAFTCRLFAAVLPRPTEGRGVFATTAAALTRLVLPSANRLVQSPGASGRVRTAGRRYYVFYAVACTLWVSVGYSVCRWLQATPTQRVAVRGPSAIEEAGFRDEDPATLLFGEDPTFRTNPLVWLFFLLLVFWVYEPLLGWCQRQRRTVRFEVALLLVLVMGVCSLFALFCAIQFVNCSIDVLFFAHSRGGTTPGVPWEVWYAGLAAVCVYLQSSSLHARIHEFVGFAPLQATGLSARLSRAFAALREWVYGSEPEPSPSESATTRLTDLRRWREFYEREGLHTLLDHGSPERVWYTAVQRMAFDRAYAELVTELGRAEVVVRQSARKLADAQAREVYFVTDSNGVESDWSDADHVWMPNT